MRIELATKDDIGALMALEARYFVGNLDAAEQAHGFISVLHSRDWFSWAVGCGGVHVAVTDTGAVAGFIAVTPPPSESDLDASPIVVTMMELAQTVMFDGRPIAEQRFAVRGPVLVDRDARGQGVYAAFNSAMRKAYAQRFDLGVLFVAVDNPVSLHTTTTKLGAQSVAIFDVVDKQYHFMVFRF